MRPVVYQLVVRLFANAATTLDPSGARAANGCGRMADITDAALASLRALGATHIWFTGIPRHATTTSFPGAPGDDPRIVKGAAGSFYAVTDWGDVSPDLAVDPTRRIDEFRALVARTHAAGLQVLIDLVPNHVSRAYRAADPAFALGVDDDQARFCAPQNNLFWLADPPGQALVLPDGGVYGSEDGRAGRAPRATGNNVVAARPAATDWYETVKLNYGWDFVARHGVYEPRPRTWDVIDRVLAFWQGLGVDGFRCDFAHYVPAPAWTWLIGRARARHASWFVAEAYPWVGSGDPIEDRAQLFAAGFDAVYHHWPYEALKRMYQGRGHHAEYLRLVAADAAESHRLMAYLENHDECRLASPVRPDGWCGDSGFGSAAAAYQLLPLHLLAGRGPVLIHNGQEVGEDAAGAVGIKADNGRSTIFDYATMPRHARWVAGHRYDGSALEPWQRELRAFHAAVLALTQDAACAGALVPLDLDPWLAAYARVADDGRCLLVVAANCRPGAVVATRLRLPAELVAHLPERVRVRCVLDRRGAVDVRLGEVTRTELATTGVPIAIDVQAAVVVAVAAM